jgi:hypothetical protein
MKLFIATMVAGCAIASAYAQNVYEGAQAIKPLPNQQLPRAPPGQDKNMDCDFEHHCYPDPHSGGSSASVNPAPKPSPPPLHQPQTSGIQNSILRPASVEDGQVLGEYARCMDQSVRAYNQAQDLNQFARMTGNCQMGLEGKVDRQDMNYPVFGTNQYRMDRFRPRRDIGCGFWPEGSDADRACAAGRLR